MVEILKGSKKLKVSNAAYENFYKNSGWIMLSVVKNNNDSYEDTGDTENIEDTGDEWDDVLNEENEKPLSEMNQAELKEKAESMGIDITGLTSNKQIRERIRSYTS